MRILAILLAAAALTLSCSESRSANSLAVELFLDQDSASVRDTLSGTIRVRNLSLKRVTVRSPHGAEGEVYIYDVLGNIAFQWPEAVSLGTHVWQVGPLCQRDYEFTVPPNRLRAGTCRLHAHPAGYLSPCAEKLLLLTD